MPRILGGIAFPGDDTWESARGESAPAGLVTDYPPVPYEEGQLFVAGATHFGVASPTSGDVQASVTGRLASDPTAKANIRVFAPRAAFRRKRRDPRRRQPWVLLTQWHTQDVVAVPVAATGMATGTASGTVVPPVGQLGQATGFGDTSAVAAAGLVLRGATAANSTGGTTATVTGTVIFRLSATQVVAAFGEGITQPANSQGGTTVVPLTADGHSGIVAIGVRGGGT